ncbi:MAG: outer membrane beta-barrel protein [Schleiferiaceae bacterium]|nr:outer membrane beta-barrel protein [Schleiferiaceae bacterium]
MIMSVSRKCFYSLKFLFFILFFIQFELIAQSKTEPSDTLGMESDTLSFAVLERSTFSKLLDDTYVFGGAGLTGIYYSNNFRHLSYTSGWVGGIEQVLPFGRKTMVATGLSVASRNALYQPGKKKVQLNNIYLDIPLSTNLELPILRPLDFRIIFGANAAFRIYSNITGDYDGVFAEVPEAHFYQTENFQNFDFGWFFGLSLQYKKFVFRARSYSGFGKLDRTEQGMLNSFTFEVGYYLFRK